MPNFFRRRRFQVELKTILAGVTGAGDQAADVADLSESETVGADGAQVHRCQPLKDGGRARPLQRQLGIVVAGVIHFSLESILRLDVREILLAIGSVDADEVMSIGELVDDNVIHEGALLGEQGGVLRLPHRETGGIVAGDLLHQVQRLRPANLNFPHVAYVEQARRRAHGQMLGDDAAVLHRHVPAGKVDHLRFQGAVGGVERSLPGRGLSFGSQEKLRGNMRTGKLTHGLWKGQASLQQRLTLRIVERGTELRRKFDARQGICLRSVRFAGRPLLLHQVLHSLRKSRGGSAGGGRVLLLWRVS